MVQRHVVVGQQRVVQDAGVGHVVQHLMKVCVRVCVCVCVCVCVFVCNCVSVRA